MLAISIFAESLPRADFRSIIVHHSLAVLPSTRIRHPLRKDQPTHTITHFSKMALDFFHVDWDTNVMLSFFEGSQQRDAVPDSPIKHFFTWYEITSRGRTRALGERFRHIFFTQLSLPDQDEWRFERP